MAVSYSSLPSSAIAGIVYHSSIFDVNKDIVVSFDYACYGSSSTGDEGFCVSFVGLSSNTVANGGPGPGLGYTPVSGITAFVNGQGYQSSFLGLSGGMIGVGFDLTGNFGTSGFGVDGMTTPVPNSITIRGSNNNNYNFLYNTGNIINNTTTPISLYQQTTDVSQLVYNRIRVRLSDFGNRVVVDIKQPQDLNFTNYVDISNNISWPTYVKGCLSFTSGITDTLLSIKNFNINGSLITK